MVDLRRLRLATFPAGVTLHTSYNATYGFGFNASGAGDTRFAPLTDDSGAVVPTLYLGGSQTAALLETIFHDVHHAAARVVFEVTLAARGLRAVTTRARLPMIDLRDSELNRLGLGRSQLVSTTAAHYPCTREWAHELHRRKIGGVAPAGLIWRSRVAELATEDAPLLADLLAGPASDAVVLFGDRMGAAGTVLDTCDPHFPDLTAGDGRLLTEQLAELLGAVIV